MKATDTIKRVVLNWRVMMLLFFLLLAIVSIHPVLENDGVTIRSALKNSTAADAGMENPPAKLKPINRERILSVNGDTIDSVNDFYSALSQISGNKTLVIETTKGTYQVPYKQGDDIGLRVYEPPSSNLRKGLDLEGGTRVLLQPEETISSEDMDSLIDNLKERLNVYGLNDVSVRKASDLSGGDFILIEIAGVTEDEVRDLLAKQGKFEARIGNSTVFFGGKNDITYVCKTPQCSGIDPSRGCANVDGGYYCSFFFGITLSPEAAQRQAEITRTLPVVTGEGQSYLNESLLLYLDDVEVDRLQIASSLKGRAETSIQITGSGYGANQQEAITATLQNMKKLQTVLITGSLPVKLSVVKMDTISPTLGKEFMDNILLVGVLAIVAVCLIILVKYKQLKIVLPMAFVLVSELILILGFASLVGWNLDLAAIAGILITVGTGVDSLIVITDEILHGAAKYDWKQKIKNAMFIVVGSYLTNISGMLPLLWAGAGLLKGFALTTIAGISFGVLIARPAYAVMIELILKE